MPACHITHEASRKYGGIGAVLAGLITSKPYRKHFNQTLLYGPLFDKNGPVENRIEHGGRIFYSGPDGLDRENFAEMFRPIETRHGVGIVYGRRTLQDELHPNRAVDVDVVLADVTTMPVESSDRVKYYLWREFGFRSDPYDEWDLEQYLRIAAPYMDILEVLYPGKQVAHLAHEYMGLPCALMAVLARRSGVKKGDTTFFYAHEVAPARSIVENLPGHEITFDNLVATARQRKCTLEDDFGSQIHNYRSELVKLADELDWVLAVGDNVKDQLIYLRPSIGDDWIKVAYNGIFLPEADFEVRQESRSIVGDYCETLFNFRPDLIMTHITRLVISKGLWRDVSLLYRLDELCHSAGLKGFYLLLSSLIASGRDSHDIAKMEANYGWPVLHRNGWPDLEGTERDIYEFLTLFNARSRAIKGVFVNQFGFSPQATGSRTPKKADTLTLRMASDLEMGMSTYEPFGIAQLETYPFGGLPLISRACGCSYLLERTVSADTYAVVDFASPTDVQFDSADTEALMALDHGQRRKIEESVLSIIAPKVFRQIRNQPDKKLFELMQKQAPALGWDTMADQIVQSILIGAKTIQTS